jgi:hypothetical protein
VLKTVEMVSGLTTPLIARVIGYEMRLEKSGLLKPLQSIGLRLLFWVPAGLLFNNALVIDHLLHLDRGFQAAVLTMFVLPPTLSQVCFSCVNLHNSFRSSSHFLHTDGLS